MYFSIGFVAMGNGFADRRGGMARWRLMWWVSRLARLAMVGFSVVVVSEIDSFFVCVCVCVFFFFFSLSLYGDSFLWMWLWLVVGLVVGVVGLLNLVVGVVDFGFWIRIGWFGGGVVVAWWW